MMEVQLKFVVAVIQGHGFERSIVVPVTYLLHNEENQPFVKYPSPPAYTEEYISYVVPNIIKTMAHPPEDWTIHKCTIKGYSETYEQGLDLAHTVVNQDVSEKFGDDIFAVPDLQTYNHHIGASSHTPTDTEPLLDTTNSSPSSPVHSPKASKSHSSSRSNSKKDPSSWQCSCSSELKKFLVKWLGPKVEDNAKRLKAVESKLVDVCEELQILRNLINISTSKTKYGDFLTWNEFTVRYDLRLPLETMDDFDDFNKELKNNRKLREDLILHTMATIDTKEPIIKSLKIQCKKYLSRSIMLSHVAQKESTGKKIFCITEFYKCLEDAFVKTCQTPSGEPIKIHTVKAAVGSVISNANDWDGNRFKRFKQ